MNTDFLRNEARFSVAIRDPVWQHIWMTPEFREITLSEPFLRLYRIKQLGPAEYVYPGATHTRAAHSFGVYHLALKVLRVLAGRGADEWVTEAGCTSFLAAALLHDLGHFPFTHSLKELPLADHETLTAALIRSGPLASLIAAAGADPEMTAAIVDKKSSIPAPFGTETHFFRNILSGVLDPDKLDYLNRDAYYCGVPYGLQDTDFILSRIQPDRERGIIIDPKAIMSIESILFSKYLMYRSVYWHKQVRIATAMMKKAVFAALEKKMIEPGQLYSRDDAGLHALLDSLDYPERELARGIRSRSFYEIISSFRFDPSDARMMALENLTSRSQAESALAECLSRLAGTDVPAEHVLVDIPERISFESDLFVTGENREFSKSSTVFTGALVGSFTSSLRIVRIAVHPSYRSHLALVDGIERKLAECLEVGYTDRQEE